MNRRTAKEYLHIRDWLSLAEQMVSRGEVASLADPVAQEAGDFILMKLGEAADRSARSDVAPPEGVRWADAIANRNWVIHQYDEIDRAVTWARLSQSISLWTAALAPGFQAAEALVSALPADSFPVSRHDVGARYGQVPFANARHRHPHTVDWV